MEEAKYVIVGGGLAGGNAAAAIREKDAEGRIVLVTEEPHRPYDRVPLSKRYLMGALSRDGVYLRPLEFYEEHKIELLTGRKASSLHAGERTLTLDDGTVLRYGRLLLATGGRPKRVPLPGSDLRGIFYLRTLEDSDAIKAAFEASKRAVVVGGGFIGCEVAAAARQKGLDVTVVEMGPYLLNMALDEPTGRWMTDFLVAKGVQARTGVRASAFHGDNGRLSALETSDGARIPADFAVVGVGVAPNVELAQAAGLKVDNGIVVDETLRTSAEGVYGAGDVARFYSPTFEKHLRVEHYDVAVRQGKIAGANMAGGDAAFTDLPYFFSDMFELKTHVHGDLSDYDRVVRRGELKVTEQGGFAQFYLKDGRLMAYLGVNRKLKDERAAQKMILARRTFDDPGVLASEATDLQVLAG